MKKPFLEQLRTLNRNFFKSTNLSKKVTLSDLSQKKLDWDMGAYPYAGLRLCMSKNSNFLIKIFNFFSWHEKNLKFLINKKSKVEKN